MAYESNSSPWMRTSLCSNRLVVRHHASTLQARGKRHKIKKIRISFLWAAVDVQPGHAITETKCKSSRERTIFFRFGSPKRPSASRLKERQWPWWYHSAHSAPMQMGKIYYYSSIVGFTPSAPKRHWSPFLASRSSRLARKALRVEWDVSSSSSKQSSTKGRGARPSSSKKDWSSLS